METSLVAGDFLKSIINAHGGIDRWRRTEKIRVTFNWDGFVLDLKGFPGPHQPTITINTHGSPASLMTNLGDGDPNDRWIFNQKGVFIESPDGVVRQERSQPREAYEGHTLAHPWDDLHLLYFISYAMVNYLTVPFLFLEPGFDVKEIGSHEECGETWRVLQVIHPEDFPTHTKVQKFYFGSNDFLLRRLDYAPDVMKEGAAAAHYCYDYKSYDGLMIPTTRRVVARSPEGKTALTGPTGFWLFYVDVYLGNELRAMFPGTGTYVHIGKHQWQM